MNIILIYDQNLKEFYYIPKRYVFSDFSTNEYEDCVSIKKDLNMKHEYVTISYYIPKKQFDYNKDGVFVIDKSVIRAIFNGYNQANDKSDYENIKEGTIVNLTFRLKLSYKKSETCLI